MSDLELALMNSQGISLEEAQRIVDDMKDQVLEGEDPEEVLLEYGLEPDYVMDIIDF